MRRYALACLLLSALVSGCSGEGKKEAASNSGQKDAPEIANPEFAAAATPDADTDEAGARFVAQPPAVSNPPATPSIVQSSAPNVASSEATQQSPTIVFDTIPTPPGLVIENETSIPAGTPDVPPNAVSRGMIRAPGGSLLTAYRLGDGRIVRIIPRTMVSNVPMTNSGMPWTSSPPTNRIGSTSSAVNSTPIPVCDPDATLPLPGEVDSCVLGGSGRYLLLSFYQLQKVGVFDLRAGKVLRYINVDSEKFSVAGGATQFVVVNHANLKLEAWKYDSLDQPRLQNTVALDNRKMVLGAVMGFSADGPLGISFSHSRTGERQGFVELFDLTTLAPLSYTVDWKGRNSYDLSQGAGNSVTVSPDGQSFSAGRNGNIETMIYDGTTLALKPRPASSFRPRPSNARLAFDGVSQFSGRQVFLSDGRIYMVEPRHSGTLLSTYPGRYWLTTGDMQENGQHMTDVEFFLTGHTKPLIALRMKVLPGTGYESSLKINNQKSVFYNGDEKTLAIIHSDRRNIFVKRLDVDEQVAKSETPVLHITSEPPREFVPGKKFEYAIQTMSNRGGVTYSLEAGPTGMTVSPQGKCEWSPSIEVMSQQTAIILVKDSVGTQVFHNVTLARGELPAFEVTVDSAPADPKEPRVAIRLPAPATDFVVGGGGRYMLANIPSKRQIAVVDVKDRRILKLLPTDDDDIKIAGGATKFVVFSGKGTLSRWSFTKLERELTVPYGTDVESIAMGSSSEGPLLLSVKKNSSCEAEFFELSTLKPSTNIAFLNYEKRHPSIEEHTAASANGQSFVSWRRGSTPMGILSYIMRGDQSLAFNRHESAGPISPSPDGSTLYTVLGECPTRGPQAGHTPDAFNESRKSSRIGLPAATGSFYLAWSAEGGDEAAREVTLHAQGNRNPILTVPGVSPPGSISYRDEDPLFSRRLLYVPDADAIVKLSPNLDSLIVHRFSFAEELAKVKTDYLFVTSIPPQELRPSTRLNYQVEAKSNKGGLQYKLAVGPTGAQVSPTGLVTWTIGSGIDGSHPFSITVTDAVGTEAIHAFTVVVDKNALNAKTGGMIASTSTTSTPPDPATTSTTTSTTTTAEIIDVGRPKSVVALPGAVERLCVGGGGRYLIGVISSLRQIVVIDVVDKKMLKLIPADDDEVRVAAGATKFVVSMGTKGVLTRYSLPGCERELTTIAPPQQKIYSLAMGCNSEGPIFATTRGDFRPPPMLLDLKNLKPIALKSDDQQRHHDFSSEIACSADGRFFVCGAVQANFADNKLQMLGGNRFDGSSGGFGLPSADGRVIYGYGGMWNVGGNRIGANDQNSALNIPAAIGPFFARIPTQQSRTKQVNPTLHVQGENQPILTIEDVEAPQRAESRDGRGPLIATAERFFLLPTADAICVLDQNQDKLNIYRFNLDEELKKTEIDYLFVVSVAPARVHPAANLAYQLDVRSKRGGIKYRLEAGPTGMTISPTGLIGWAPKGADAEEKVVIAAVSDASGQELFHTFKLKVDAAAPNAPAVGTTVPKSGLASATGAASTPPAVTSVAPTTPPPAAEAAPMPAVAEAASAPGERVKHTLKLPAAVDDVCVGGGGKYLVVRMSSLKQAAIIDVAAKKVLKYLPVDDDQFFIAAGNTKLVVGMSSKSVLTRYDLATGARELTVPYAGQAISAMVMGSSSEGPLFTGHRDSYDLNAVFIDLRTLKPIEMGKGDQNRMYGRFASNVRVSADGTLFGSWSTGLSPTGLNLVALNGNTMKYYNEHNSVGVVLPSPDARIVYTGLGMYTPMATPLSGNTSRGYATASPIPAASGPLYLNFSIGSVAGSSRDEGKNALTLHMQGETSPIMNVEGIELPKTERNMHPAHVARLHIDKQIFLLPVATALVTIPSPGDAIHIHRFDLDEELRRSEVDYLFVASVPPAAVKAGEMFRYQVEGKSKRGGIKYRLESGPTGMAVSPQGVVSWKAVRSGETEEVVIIALSDASGQETFHTFKIRIDSGAGGSATTSTNSTPPTPSPSSTAAPTASATGTRPSPQLPPPIPAGPRSTATSAAIDPDSAPVPTPTASPSGTVPAVSVVVSPVRTWKSRDGMFSIEARLVIVAGGKVTLIRPNGERLVVAIDQLSKDDQDFIAKPK